MNLSKPSRSLLKSYFKKNSIPTEDNFAELIEGMLNFQDDGIGQTSNGTFGIQSSGDTNDILNMYSSFNADDEDDTPLWSISLNPRGKSADVSTANAGFSINNSSSMSQFFIEQDTGNIGIGTNEPSVKLQVESGDVNVVSGNISADAGKISGQNLVSSNDTSTSTLSVSSTLHFTDRGLSERLYLWGDGFSLGIQPNSIYSRTQGQFYWYYKGGHSDKAGDSGKDVRGDTGTNMLELKMGQDSTGNTLPIVDVKGMINLNTGPGVRQSINMWGDSYGLGIQNSTLYFRTNDQFCWFYKGSHSNTKNDPGLNSDGETSGTNMLTMKMGKDISGDVVPILDVKGMLQLSTDGGKRQSINLYGNNYGIGYQTSAMYFRTSGQYSWFYKGSHSDTKGNAGTNGVNMLDLKIESNIPILDTPGNIRLNKSGGGRQSIDMWDNQYGLGIQNSTLYNRTAGQFCWFYKGVHSDTKSDAGKNGVNMLELKMESNVPVLDTVGNIRVNKSGGLRQSIDMWDNRYGLGIQSATLYFRTATQFCWFLDGSHSNTKSDPGSLNGTKGKRLMALGATGDLILSARTNPTGDSKLPACRALVDAGKKLCINYGGDYADGTFIQSNLVVSGTATVSSSITTPNIMSPRINGVPYIPFSDKRLKKNIASLEGALDTLLQLSGKTFEWKQPEKYSNMTGQQRGFIAQDVEKVIPQWVHENDEGMKLLACIGFEAMAVEAIRELTERVQKLEAQLANA